MTSASSSRLFRAFSDSTRLRLLHALGEGELCVGDLVSILRSPQPSVSRHLGYLLRSGMVKVRREGRWCFYARARATTRFHAKLLECLESCLGGLPEIRGDRARARRLRKSGGCCPRPSAKGIGR